MNICIGSPFARFARGLSVRRGGTESSYKLFGMFGSSVRALGGMRSTAIVVNKRIHRRFHRLTRAEFERRYEAMPQQLAKAECIEGFVHLLSPVRFCRHGQSHFSQGLLFVAETIRERRDMP